MLTQGTRDAILASEDKASTGANAGAQGGLSENPSGASASLIAGKGLYVDPNSATASPAGVWDTSTSGNLDVDAVIMETNFGSVSELPFAPPASYALDATNDAYGASMVALVTQGSRQPPAHHGSDSVSDVAVAGTVSHGSPVIAETRFDVGNAASPENNPTPLALIEPNEDNQDGSGNTDVHAFKPPAPHLHSGSTSDLMQSDKIAVAAPPLRFFAAESHFDGVNDNNGSASNMIVPGKGAEDSLHTVGANATVVVTLPVVGSTSTDDVPEDHPTPPNTHVHVPTPSTTVEDERVDIGSSTFSITPAVEPTKSISHSIWVAAGDAVTADGLMSAGTVATRLTASGLAQKALRTVWSEAKATATTKSSAGTMNKEEFAIACDLAIKAGGVFP
jgi:hypothetical protein